MILTSLQILSKLDLETIILVLRIRFGYQESTRVVIEFPYHGSNVYANAFCVYIATPLGPR